MNPLRILLLAALVLVVFGVGNVSAEVGDPYLEYVGSYSNTDATIHDVAISGNFAYLAADKEGLVILNIEDPTNPILAGSYDTCFRNNCDSQDSQTSAYRVVIVGNYAYVDDWNNGVGILNIEDPTEPIEVGVCDYTNQDTGMVVLDNYIYTLTQGEYLIVQNIENPADCSFVSQTSIGFGRDLEIIGDYAYIASNRGLEIINITNHTEPTHIGYYEDDSFESKGLTISGNYTYLVAHITTGERSLVILNIEDPTNPTYIGGYITGLDFFRDVEILENYAYISGNGIIIIDIEDPATPTYIGNYTGIENGIHLSIIENYVYITSNQENEEGESGGVFFVLIVDYENPIYDYSVTFTDDIVHLDVRPGANGIGCTDMDIYNQGTTTIDVDVALSGSGITISPGAVSVTLGPEGSITIPICALALTRSEARIVQVSALGSGRETNTQLNQVQVISNFTASIDPYARLSFQAQQPSASHCIGSTFETNFTGVNNGNANDSIVFELTNIQELEDAGFTITLPILQYQVDAAGEQPMSIKVVAENVTPGIYTMIVKISTTMEGETESRTVTATVNMTNCQEDDSDSADTETPLGFPTAIAGPDTSIEPGGTVQFSGAGTDEDGSIVEYEWDFDGDGVYEWSSNENGLTTFIFNNAGIYTATLRVIDNDGNTATDSLSVTVKSPEEESGLPSISLITSLFSIGLLAIFRRK